MITGHNNRDHLHIFFKDNFHRNKFKITTFYKSLNSVFLHIDKQGSDRPWKPGKNVNFEKYRKFRETHRKNFFSPATQGNTGNFFQD